MADSFEAIRSHVEKHADKERATFSIAGIKALLDAITALRNGAEGEVRPIEGLRLVERDEDALICAPHWQLGFIALARRPALMSNEDWRPIANRIIAALTRNAEPVVAAAPSEEQVAWRREDADYLCDEQRLPLGEIGAGDAMAIFDDMPSTPEEAFAMGWNIARRRAVAALASPAVAPVAPAELINRLQDAVEGECEGLAIDEDQARAILEHVGVAPVAVSVKPFEAAMRQLTRVDVAQYLLSNTRARSNGAAKALAHASLTTSYVAVLRDIDPDRVRRRCEADYKAVHDATADELTNHLDRVIGFDLDACFDDEVAERFFLAFHRIAVRVLSPSIIPATKGGEDLRKLIYDALDLSDELRAECTDAVLAALAQDTDATPPVAPTGTVGSNMKGIRDCLEAIEYASGNCIKEHGQKTVNELAKVALSCLAALSSQTPDETIYRIEHDGFIGTIIGSYTTREGKRGVVLQQVGTRVVHVYGEKWLAPPVREGSS